MSRLLFLTSTNLACNPRCLKEVELAVESGHDVTVFAFDMANWTRSIENEIRNRLSSVKYFSLQTDKKPLAPWLFTSVIGKVARLLFKIGVRSTLVNAIATDKRTFSLISALSNNKPVCDLIIAHNPGAFYPAWWLSNKMQVPFAIDVEDFHPGENNDAVVRKAVTSTMQKILPSAKYVSFASPLIGEATLGMLKSTVHDQLVINNVFPAKEFPAFQHFEHAVNDKLKLVWFSQYVNFGRGLEEMLPALKPLNDQIQLTIIGNVDKEFKHTILDRYKFIVLKEPLTQQLLNAELGKHDIGLAIESNNADSNRKICLTNKIWAYLQAGLFIWASNTPAQVLFSKEFPGHTSLFDLGDREAVKSLTDQVLTNLPELRIGKSSRLKVNQLVSWDVEKKKVAKKWNTILKG